ncbi:MFS transporter [Limosilactobacillus sp. RRLNB_1_1]|uniref:MFS transporter n=1 Tax=Limosilactobacillus albertensis TaxID=2759752 RepID=A0A7W3TRL5_9LACO|nr:MFS transporter [Limosilactobacillus albertensis]MBB1069585.1 MFS transporter [Limosilactobacillus albertensis]MCD7118112.1 MFS transporter [Limosilactobacillus albertensis]MCD7127634.1 MFS transporter [Limosilactobacillus albertensis]
MLSEKAVKSRPPYRIGIGLAIGVLSWLLPYVGVNSTLLPALLQKIAPAQKVQIIAEVATIGMIVAAIANVVFGALSDRTRSRHGRRTPWIIIGSIGSAICFWLITITTSIPMLLVIWGVYQAALNAVVGPLLAILSDLVPKKYKGTIASFYGIANSVANPLGTIVASQFLTKINMGIWTMIAIQLILGFLCVAVIHEPGNKDDKVEPLHGYQLIEAFIFPVHGQLRDFYLSLFGKLLIVAAHYIIVGYQLYIFMDYMKLSSGEAASSLSIMSTILMFTGMFFAAISGPIADKIGSIKKMMVIASVGFGIGVLMPFFDPQPWTMFAYAVIGGSCYGIYNSIDQALNVSVLPSKKAAAKDLGILNLANTIGQILGPIVASVVITQMGYHLIFMAAFIMCVIGGVLFQMIRKVA